MAPTTAELYGVLLKANRLEPYLLGYWVGRREPLTLSRLNKLHFLAGGNEVFHRLLRLLRAPNLDMLDIRVMDTRDCESLLGCAELVRAVRTLRIYGAVNSDLDLLALSILMPDVTVLDVTTADRALARCAAMSGFKWTKVQSLQLRLPRMESIQSILASIDIGYLHIHYPFPAKMLRSQETEWISTKVGTVVLSVEETRSAENLVTEEILVGSEMRVEDLKTSE
ncbi:hypothetical protein B0H14DRAFT_2591140 [Mycena olivaceomarginata]|nr:hypothetical protein B0H14DRAFT_2591140 [Mycena olivaceomarginata]